MIYKLKIKEVNNMYLDLQVDYQDINIDSEAPCGIKYRTISSTTWSQQRQDQWWDFIDFVLIQNNISISDFVFVWNVEVNNIIYGLTNNPI